MRSGCAGTAMSDVLRVRDLKVYLDVDAGVVKAVDGVSFGVPEGGTVALVGDSGSGKSMVAHSIMSILPKVARIEGGEILFFDPDGGPQWTDIAKAEPNRGALTRA